MNVVFDVETGPLDDDLIQSMFVPKSKEEFVGAQRWKPETVDAKYSEYLTSALSEFKSKAALKAISGTVLAIGYKSLEKTLIHGVGESIAGIVLDEREVINRFWNNYKNLRESSRNIIGFNIEGFDLPFLVQRSFILGITVPRSLFQNLRYLDSIFVDLRKVWCAGQWNGEGTLDQICKACGLGSKSEGEVKGANFYEYWRCSQEDREKAKGYLVNDLDMTWALADRLGYV
jgi:DNA polymerase elongation subunit (family B)